MNRPDAAVVHHSSFILHHSYGFFLFGGAVVVVVVVAVVVVDPGVLAVCLLVITPPSSSERLSSMSTVCVIASVPVGVGSAWAGAMVWVFGVPGAPGSPLFRSLHAQRASTTGNSITTTDFFNAKTSL